MSLAGTSNFIDTDSSLMRCARSIPRPTSNSRISSVFVGTIVLMLGILGGSVSLINVSQVLDGETLERIRGGASSLVLRLDAMLNLTAKIGLVFVGVTLLRRSRLAMAVTVTTFLISSLDSYLYLTHIVVPRISAGSIPESSTPFLAVSAATAVSAELYATIILYLIIPRTREEFAAAANRHQ